MTGLKRLSTYTRQAWRISVQGWGSAYGPRSDDHQVHCSDHTHIYPERVARPRTGHPGLEEVEGQRLRIDCGHDDAVP